MATLSVSRDGGLTNFAPRTGLSFDSISQLICEERYSPIVYKNDQRSQKNFDYAEVIALDFDDGMTIAEAQRQFKDYRYIIAPTKSHQKEKNGKICDRFRVILFLSERVKDLATYRATAENLLNQYPAADKACKDGARFFEPSIEVAKTKKTGRNLRPSLPKPVVEATVEVDFNGVKGELSRATYQFLTFGAPDGEWNRHLHKATVDLHEQGYTEAEAMSVLKRITGHLDDNDIKTIAAQYAREVKYDKRKKESFDIQPLGQIIKNKPQIKWLTQGLLSKGGASIIAGQPKSGKSTLTRQLAQSVIQGTEFLGRKCKPGKVLYLAFEEQEEMLYEQFKTLGVKETEDRILIHIGRVNFTKPFQVLKDAIEEIGPALVIVDTLLLLDRFDVNSYNEVNDACEKLRDVARKTGAHICAIHHQNKNTMGGTTSIMGSNAFHGAVDCAMVITKPHGLQPGERVLDSSQRGGKPFNGQLISFDFGNETYKIGGSNEV